ncbi:MAG: ABC transporter substrate-binding protein [Desulfurococcaceae archaeon]|nr:ABC transporter substrate-binding protein [Desulfurococcaceae archaeon]
MKSTSLVLRYVKTVKLDIILGDKCEILDLTISGDFFAYPEESIGELESKLRKCSSRVCIEEAFKEISSTIVLGVDIEDLKSKIISLLETCTSS